MSIKYDTRDLLPGCCGVKCFLGISNLENICANQNIFPCGSVSAVGTSDRLVSVTLHMLQRNTVCVCVCILLDW